MLGTSPEMNAAVAGGPKSIFDIAHVSDCATQNAPADAMLSDLKKHLEDAQNHMIVAHEGFEELTHALREIATHAESKGGLWASEVAQDALGDSNP